ncbi:G-protein coupled receptor family C group 6 member A isoform X1 [Chiroxiphia lanceolata]|uniref:G-protein coupled receptor family C group 6 member A isoform X1 n=1 Tax=Chiroxiphia lanceolata TaxID=296741 RepID=UPI0013CE6C54|nr:G-protein coupled receptor family C group 6 member A isoform X1 [Chiroxiphia lanceolata]
MAFVSFLVPCFVIGIDLAFSCQNAVDFVGASSPGDIIIGGLFAVHNEMLHPEDPIKPVIQNCAGFEIQVFLQTLAMIHAIETINNSTLLSGVTLGYEIYDTCAEVTKAMASALRFLSKFNSSEDAVEFKCNYSNYIPRIKAVIGATYSEVSMAVSRLLALQLIPQEVILTFNATTGAIVSPASSAEILSDKIRFPSFFRTIPSDFHQTRAMTHLICESGWNWIGVIATDDDNGRFALESFGVQAMVNNVCIAFKEMLPAYLSDSTFNTKVDHAIEKIVKETRVNVIVVFMRQFHVLKLFKKAVERNVNKIWIASDNWSTAVKISTIPNIRQLGTIVGFGFKSGDMSSFQNFLRNLHEKPTKNNKFLREYIMLLSVCANLEYYDFQTCISNQSQDDLLEDVENKHQIWRDDFLNANIEPGFIQSTILAVYAIAHAIKGQCKNRNCKDPSTFTPWELLEELKKVVIIDDDKEAKFDSNGDMSTSYDVLLWKEIDGHMEITTMAEYDAEKGDFIFEDEEKKKDFLDLKKVQSTCSQHCKPGQMKKVTESPHTCCYECVYCPENHYSNRTDMDYCYRCNNKTYWAPINSTTCYKKTIYFLTWTDWFAVFLLLLSAFGVVLVLSICVIFTKNLNTPVVKASGGLTVCYVILFSHFLIFLSTIFFIDVPTEFKCKTRQALFGISFTLCISCILMKSLKILLAFSFDPKLQNFLKCMYKPIPTVATCTGIQVIICTFWLIFRTPFVTQNFSIPRAIILECNEGSIVAFGIMLGYIAALAFICFIFAFKGRKLPENYNEAKFITFGMLIYFIAWIVFIPVYATTFGKYLPAVEIIVVLISNYGILCCTFLPKCYIIIYKQETNTKSAFLKMVYKYSSKSAGSLNVSQVSLDSKSPSFQAPISDSCKTDKNSVNGNCQFQLPGQPLIKGKVLPKNAARKRVSSI